MLEKPFPEADEASRQSKWNALVKKLISIRFLETYHALGCQDGGMIGQFEHTILVNSGGPEILTVEQFNIGFQFYCKGDNNKKNVKTVICRNTLALNEQGC